MNVNDVLLNLASDWRTESLKIRKVHEYEGGWSSALDQCAIELEEALQTLGIVRVKVNRKEED